MASLKIPTAKDEMVDIANMRSTLNTGAATHRQPNSDFKETKLKPTLFENKILKNKDFFRLSDGFQKIFAQDSKDQSLRIPIAGYGGHTRGDWS